MLIENKDYRRNQKTGEIVKRQEVLLKCDQCETQWETFYDQVKRKIKAKGLNAKDYCVSCRHKGIKKLGNKWNTVKKKVQCLGCKEEFSKVPSKVRKNNFCSLKCRDEYLIEHKYAHLYKSFEDAPNEVAYLFGLILGDGHNKKQEQKTTTRISIAFDVKHKGLMSIFEKVAKKLKIKYFIEPKFHSHCQMIGFVLPDKLLEKYNMLYSGAKYNNQPSVSNNVTDNINFAAGMINSDGYCGYTMDKRSNKYKRIMFSNTVFSIIKNLKTCLEKNNIDYTSYFVNGKFDKRTGKVNKDFWTINLCNKISINKLINRCVYDLKEFRQCVAA